MVTGDFVEGLASLWAWVTIITTSALGSVALANKCLEIVKRFEWPVGLVG